MRNMPWAAQQDLCRWHSEQAIIALSEVDHVSYANSQMWLFVSYPQAIYTDPGIMLNKAGIEDISEAADPPLFAYHIV